MVKEIESKKEIIIELLNLKNATGTPNYTYGKILSIVGIEDTATNRKTISDIALNAGVRRRRPFSRKAPSLFEEKAHTTEERFIKAWEAAGAAFVSEFFKEA